MQLLSWHYRTVSFVITVMIIKSILNFSLMQSFDFWLLWSWKPFHVLNMWYYLIFSLEPSLFNTYWPKTDLGCPSWAIAKEKRKEIEGKLNWSCFRTYSLDYYIVIPFRLFFWLFYFTYSMKYNKRHYRKNWRVLQKKTQAKKTKGSLSQLMDE